MINTNNNGEKKEYCCTGLIFLGLVPGEEVRILEGVKLEVEPERVTARWQDRRSSLPRRKRALNRERRRSPSRQTREKTAL